MNITKVPSLLLPWIPFVPLLASLLVVLLRPPAATRRILFLATTGLGLVLSVVLSVQVISSPDAVPIVLVSWGEYLYADGLTAILLCCIYLLVSAVGIYSVGYLEREVERGLVPEDRLWRYDAVLLVFSASMTWTVTFNNLVFMYLAIEVSTIATAYLVSLYRTRESLEAAFKYNLLVIMALLFALMGTIVVYSLMSDSVQGLGAIHVLEIGRSVAMLPPAIALSVVAFLVCAFGTESGMIPFHAWLPDAHSQAPTPISALLSGVVITIGAYCLARTVTLFTATFPSVVVLLATIASASIVIGILMAIVQDDLKRLLAYSSISQISYIFEGLGLGTYLGVYGGLFHAVTHMLAKSLLFFCAGAIIYRTGIRRISELGGLARKMPFTATCFFIGSVSMGGMPLLAGFMSKYSIILAVGKAGLWWAMGISAFAGLLTLACMVWAGWRVFWGPECEKVAALPSTGREIPRSMMVPMAGAAGLIILLGLAPGLLFPSLDSATRSILGVMGPGQPSVLEPDPLAENTP